MYGTQKNTFGGYDGSADAVEGLTIKKVSAMR